jgi:hypothetical protein
LKKVAMVHVIDGGEGTDWATRQARVLALLISLLSIAGSYTPNRSKI